MSHMCPVPCPGVCVSLYVTNRYCTCVLNHEQLVQMDHSNFSHQRKSAHAPLLQRPVCGQGACVLVCLYACMLVCLYAYVSLSVHPCPSLSLPSLSHTLTPAPPLPATGAHGLQARAPRRHLRHPHGTAAAAATAAELHRRRRRASTAATLRANSIPTAAATTATTTTALPAAGGLPFHQRHGWPGHQ